MAESQERAPRGPGLVVRLTPDERDAWHAAARAAGYAQTARWVRAVVGERLSGGERRQARVVVPDGVLGQLGKIGSNLNQVAHRVNVAALNGQPVDASVEELEALRRELAKVRGALEDLAYPPVVSWGLEQ